MSSHRFTAAAVLVLCATCPSVLAGAGIEPLATARVASALDRPVYVTHAPGDESRLFIVEQRGVIKILDLDTLTVLPTPFLNIDSLVGGPSNSFDERGLLGLAFHPNYADNGFFYVNYTNNGSDTIISRYTVSADPDIADPGSGFQILFINQPQTNHNGGWIDFGPADGYLYVATGDGGNFCDSGSGHTSATGNGQDITNNLLGKILRIDVDGGSPYATPPDNPFVSVTGDDEIWAYGLRNPWRNGFDLLNGDLYIGDVGQDAREEINYQEGASGGGENYGWRCFEGFSCSSISGCPTSPCDCDSSGLVMPVHDYAHNLGFSVTGGYVYRGCDIPSLQGTYFFGDFGTSRIWTFRIVGGVVTEFTERTGELNPSIDGFSISSISSFGLDARGEMYIIDRSGTTNGEIFKIVPENTLGDFDGDGVVGFTDLLAILAAWGPCAPPCLHDLNCDGDVGFADLLLVLSHWGP